LSLNVSVKPGRNDPCPCGSGKRYKRCCGQIEPAPPPAPSATLSPEQLSPGQLSQLVALLSAGRYPELERRSRELTERHPDSGAAWKALGVSLTLQHKDALPALRRATELSPDDAEAHSNLASALMDLGRLEAAVASYRRALELKSDHADAHINLGNALRGLGRPDEALASYRRALEIKPDYAEVHNNEGNVLRGLGRPGEALLSYGRALSIKPDYLEALGNLAGVLLDLGRLEDAAASYRRALAIKPDLPEAHNNLGNTLLELGQLEEATASYRAALALNPDYAEAHNNLGIALRLRGHTAEAEASCRRALELDPGLAPALVVLADAHADTGRFAEAEALFRRAIVLEPDSPQAWAGIAHLRKMSDSDAPWLANALRIAAQKLSPRMESLLRYAIGKYFDDTKAFDQAFLHYRRANELAKSQRIKHDRQQCAQAIGQLIQSYDRKWLEQARIHGLASARPVFIVGMPRSGTSLAEQILASHPSVFGAGELTYWGGAAATYEGATVGQGINGKALRTLADTYLRLLEASSTEALHVIDKMPGNFLHLGLIHAALPNARFIHMRRNPIDTCLSIYFQDFKAMLSYANDLDDLAHYYTQYLRLMRHWQGSLPAESTLTVPYEDLVEDQAAWSRKMFEFIGLSWESRYLDFHERSRTVVTASKWQVRQKISSSSVARWRNYEKHIGPLRRLLEAPET
jgi:tetratricopeptide (TPR) repeat protein